MDCIIKDIETSINQNIWPLQNETNDLSYTITTQKLNHKTVHTYEIVSKQNNSILYRIANIISKYPLTENINIKNKILSFKVHIYN